MAARLCLTLNNLINTPGDYTIRLTVWNCVGAPRDQVLNFRVNRPRWRDHVRTGTRMQTRTRRTPMSSQRALRSRLMV